jgi:hypothetical protein
LGRLEEPEQDGVQLPGSDLDGSRGLTRPALDCLGAATARLLTFRLLVLLHCYVITASCVSPRLPLLYSPTALRRQCNLPGLCPLQ